MVANAFWSGKAASLNHGTYSDGHPLDEIHYLECKLILKPDRFTCVKDFHEYGNIVSQAASECNIGFLTKRALQLKPRIREVLFLDYPYPAKAGCPTIAGRRRTRAAPTGMAPALSWS